MSAKNTGSKTDWHKLRSMRDKEIDFSDSPPITSDEWAQAAPFMPPGKTPVTLRLDVDILEWFKAQGPRYQTRINAMLRWAVGQHKKP